MGYDVDEIEVAARNALGRHGVGLREAHDALLGILLDNLRLVQKLDLAIRRDGVLVTLPNGITTAHPGLRPRDQAIRRAMLVAKELGVVVQQPGLTARTGEYDDLLRGYRRV